MGQVLGLAGPVSAHCTGWDSRCDVGGSVATTDLHTYVCKSMEADVGGSVATTDLHTYVCTSMVADVGGSVATTDLHTYVCKSMVATCQTVVSRSLPQTQFGSCLDIKQPRDKQTNKLNVLISSE